ncbi:MAG: hypothetical protein SPE74_05905 [Oscillospiraceae bacterium]|nr:hypothetical protein [Oscillospiraceae bacterium]
MNGNSFFNRGLLQVFLSLILVIALGIGLFAPGVDMKTAQPEDPLEAQEVLDISVLEVSENISSLTPVVVPTGGRATPPEPEESEDERENEETEAADGSENGEQDGEQDGLQGEEGGTLVPKLAVILSWKENRREERSLACEPGGVVSADILNNSLSGGVLDYEVSLFGEDMGDAFIELVLWETNGSPTDIGKKGTIPMMGGTCRITVTVLINGNRVPFRFDLNHITDVTLKMEYTVWENGSAVTCEAICENKDTCYPADIYTNQLEGGMLDYNFSIVGVEGGVEINSVKCFQAATRTSQSIDPAGRVELLLKDGKRAENTFFVQAEGNGKSYEFTVSMYYRPRGAEILQIDTYDLYDGMTITTGSNMNLRLSAWRMEDGNKVYIPAEGSDTEFTMTFNHSTIYPVTSNGRVHDYIVVPPDPVIGDVNEHILTIYAEDSDGNWGEKTLLLYGKRAQEGQVVGTAQIYVDMTVLGLGLHGPLQYEVRAGEPCSFVALKALAGWDMGEIYGSPIDSFGWSVGYDVRGDVYNPKAPFFLESINPGYTPVALDLADWPLTESGEKDLDAIDRYFPENPEIATLWRCLANNGLDLTGNDVPEDGITNEDYTSGSGWMYRINDDPFANMGLEKSSLKNGDTLTLVFTLAGGWDIGGTGSAEENSSGYCIRAAGGRLVPNQATPHRMDGDRCVCCGRVETCPHTTMVFVDLGNGCHVEKCNACDYTSGEQEHRYDNTNGDDIYHYCLDCQSPDRHFWQDTVIREPSCTESGEVYRVCAECGMDKTEYPPGQHEFVEGQHVSEMGFDELGHFRICNKCGDSKDYIYFQFYWDETECLYKCMCSSDCTYSHDFESVGAFGCEREPPIDESRSDCTLEVRYCGTCGNYLYKPGSFHSYADGICTRCGEAEPDAS